MRASLLRPDDADAVVALASSDVDMNLFLLGVLDERPIGSNAAETWIGAADPTPVGKALQSVALVARTPLRGGRTPAELVVPAGADGGCKVIGEVIAGLGGCRVAVGPRSSTDALWAGLGSPQSRLFYDQRLYVCSSPPSGPGLSLRLARLSDHEWITEWSGLMMLEDLGEDPRDRDAYGYASAVRSRIRDERVLVGEIDGDPVFKLDIGTSVRLGAQVGGTYVPPEHRGKGLAAMGMRAAARYVLQSYPRVTLHVNEANLPAVRCYESSGFRRAGPMRLASAL